MIRSVPSVAMPLVLAVNCAAVGASVPSIALDIASSSWVVSFETLKSVMVVAPSAVSKRKELLPSGPVNESDPNPPSSTSFAELPFSLSTNEFPVPFMSPLPVSVRFSMSSPEGRRQRHSRFQPLPPAGEPHNRPEIAAFAECHATHPRIQRPPSQSPLVECCDVFNRLLL